MKTGARLLGLVLLPLLPAVAAWALYVFRKSEIPEDHSYPRLLRGLAAECWNLVKTGEFFGDEQA